MEEKKVLIKGKNIQLRTTTKSDMDLKVRWYNDPDVNKTLVLPEKLELNKTYEWFEKAQKDTNRFDMVIETIDGIPIGVIGLKNINKNNRSALLYIVIGEKDHWGKGLGLEAELLAIHYGFEALELHRVLGTALENNPASIAVCKKVGFFLEGTSRDDYYKDGKFFNVHKYSIRRDEFYEKHPAYKKIQIQSTPLKQTKTTEKSEPSQKEYVTISGKDLKLRPLEEQDLETKVKWINDPDVHKYLHYRLPLDIEKTKNWFRRIANDFSRYDYVIEKQDYGPIGLTGLLGIDRFHESAEFYITLGEKQYWNKGFGQQALSILVDWAFRHLNLYKIWGTTRTTNLASISMIKKVGFKIEGTLKQEKKVGDKRVDVVRVGLLRDEFKSVKNTKG